MYTSLSITSDTFDELRPKSSLPWVWFGFLFVAAFIIEETLMIVLELDESAATPVLFCIALAGWLYWLFCVYRFHTILQEMSRHRYPISGAEAAGKHFIPFYNLYWIFRWPAEMSDYLNRQQRVRMVSGHLLGGLLLLFVLFGRFLDGGLGLAGILTVGMYMSAKLRKHIELMKISPEKLPPPPDPTLFASAPETQPSKL